MSDEKFVVLVVGELGDNVRQQRWLDLLQEFYGDRIEIVHQSSDEIKGIAPDFVITDEYYPPVVPSREVYKPERYAYWQRGRWGQ